MNTHNFNMIWIKRISTFTMLLSLAFWGLNCFAQTRASVNVNVNIIPPYSPYYADYAGPNAGKVLLIVQNLSSAQLTIKLVGQLQGDNGIKISTKPNYVPLQPIVLNPNETKQLNGLALKDIFDLNSLDVSGIDKNKLIYTSRLPEGNYSFCVQAVDMGNNQVISSAAPLGCTSISIAYPEAPVNVSPTNSVALTVTNPQSVVFNWINPGNVPPTTQYLLQVAEMPVAGSDPNQVLNAVSFPLINKTVLGTSYVLNPSDPPLIPGKMYAWRVQAIDATSKVIFKNEGKSKAFSFVYGTAATQLSASNDLKLYSINPDKDNAQLTVTDKLPLNFGWILVNTLDGPNSPKSAPVALDTTLYKQVGIKKYFVVVTRKNAGMNEAPVLFSALVVEKDNALHHNFKKSKKEAIALGLKDKEQYFFQVQGLDANDKALKKSDPVLFTFNYGTDQVKNFYVQVKTQLKYTFGGKPGEYAVAKTPVTVKIRPKSQNNVALSIVPTFEGSAETDVNGNLKLVVAIPERYKDWSLSADMIIASGYYRSDSLKKISIPAFKSDTNYVELGTQYAGVYGYGLKLYVQKEFPAFKVNEQGKSWVAGVGKSEYAYDEKGNLVYQVTAKEYEAGVPIRLYRKGKQAYVPPGEGTINKLGLIQKEVDVLIAEGKTQLEVVGGVTKSFVKFEKLLCNIYDGDEYYALAIDATNIKAPASSGRGVSKYAISAASESVLGSGYTATEKTIRFLPKKDSVYLEYKETYTILSNKPPQSLVSGRITYKWAGNKDNVSRAYANQSFHIKVGYRFKYSTGEVAYVSPSQEPKSGEENYFVKSGNGKDDELVLLRDDGIIAGAGKTDETGRFTLQIDNLGYKGGLGSGKLTRSSDPLKNWKKEEKKPAQPSLEGLLGLYNKGLEDEDWGQSIGDKGSLVMLPASQTQNVIDGNTSLSGALSGFTLSQSNTKAGSFTITSYGNANAGAQTKAKAQGLKSGPSEQDQLPFDFSKEDDGVLERVFIIVPDNYHLIEAAEPLVVQPFEVKDGGQFTALVWETKLTVHAKKENGNPLGAMKVAIFRTKEQKFLNMPLGEGDNQYHTAKLINPQIKQVKNVNVVSGTIAANGIYDQEFEKLWEGTTSFDGTFVAPQLFAGTDYYLQVTSDPTNGKETYESYIQYVDRMYNAEEQLTVTLKALPTRVAGRLMEGGQSGQPVPWGMVFFDDTWAAISDKEGYFEVLGSNPKYKFPIKELKVTAAGYSDYSENINIVSAVGQQFYKDIQLQLGVIAQGFVGNRDLLNANGQTTPVQAYVRRSNGAMVLTGKDGYYNIRVKSVGADQPLEKLEIIPLDVAYFTENVVAHKAAMLLTGKKVYDLVVPRRHRMNFVINRPNAHGGAALLPGISVQVEEHKATSDNSGNAVFNFPNVSVDNYTAVITGNPKDDWIPQVFNVKNEETKNPVYYYVTMKLGNTVNGNVTLDGLPVANAKVYLEYKESSKGVLGSNATLIQTRSAKDGSFSLKGIPIDPSNAFVIATLDTNFTVTGSKQPALKNGAGPTLTLTSLKTAMVKSVHGFPLSVEELKPGYLNNEFLVTGIVDLSKGASRFKINDQDAKVRIREVRYKLEGNYLVPVNPEVKIEGTNSLTLKYLNKYNVQVLNNTGNGMSELVIVKNAAGRGELKGLAKIIDNSFNYPGSYLNFTTGDDFYLADKVGEGSINPIVASMIAQSSDIDYLNSIKNNTQLNLINPYKYKAFQISNAQGKPINFKFIDFDATANPQQSYVAEDGKIHLNVKLECNVPNSNPSVFSVDLKDVVIDDKKVYPGKGAPIELMLEKWKLIVSDWSFDPEKGGILSKNAVIKTTKLDIPIGFFNLRSDMMVFDTINAQQLTIGGGVTKLDNVKSENAVLIYDTKTGSDMQAHWRMSVSGSGNSPAAQLNLAGLGKLDVSYVQVLSNDESILSIAPVLNPLRINLNTMTEFTPQTITNGPDFFEVNGSLNLNAPRMAPFLLDIAYTKSGQKLNPIDVEFEGKGYVHFIAKNKQISITKDLVTIAGQVEEKPNKSFETMDATFYAQNNGYRVDLKPNYMLNLSDDGKQKFQISNGGMAVKEKDWSILSFSGKLISPGEIKENLMTFNVYGDVQVYGNSIQTGSSTPFGQFKMVYDFNAGSLFGSLNFPEKNFGAYSLAGNVEMMIASEGFYFLGSGKLSTAIPIVGGGYTVGFLITDYIKDKKAISQATWNTLQAFQLNKNNCFYEANQKDFKGFYLTAGRSLIDFQRDYDFVIVAGYVEAKAAAELSIWANFAGEASIGASIGATARMKAGMSSITGTSMSGGFNASGAVILGYNKGFTFGADLAASFNAHVSQSLILTSVEFDKSVAAKLHFGTDGYKLDFSSGTDLPDCPPKK